MEKHSKRIYIIYGFFGLSLGLVLSLGGLTEFAQIHSLFILQNTPLLLVFAGAIGISMTGFMLIKKSHKTPGKPFTRGTIPGSILFGVGWAITGACPSIALVQVGEGQLAALMTVAGILAGVWMYRRGLSPELRPETGVCGEE